MARRSEHSLEQIREMVLNAAKHIIQEEGIEALTVRKIALEIGYTVGSIYMVFANMQDLILHVKAKTLDELSADLPPQTADTCVEQQIFCLANYYLQFATQHFNLWRIIFTADLANVSNAPDWYREKIDLTFAPMEALLIKLCPDYLPEDNHLAAKILCCGIHGICLMALNGLFSHDKLDNANAVRILVNNFVKGWR